MSPQLKRVAVVAVVTRQTYLSHVSMEKQTINEMVMVTNDMSMMMMVGGGNDDDEFKSCQSSIVHPTEIV